MIIELLFFHFYSDKHSVIDDMTAGNNFKTAVPYKGVWNEFTVSVDFIYLG